MIFIILYHQGQQCMVLENVLSSCSTCKTSAKKSNPYGLQTAKVEKEDVGAGFLHTFTRTELLKNNKVWQKNS